MEIKECFFRQKESSVESLEALIKAPEIDVIRDVDYGMSMALAPLFKETIFYQVTPLLLLDACRKIFYLWVASLEKNGTRIYCLGEDGDKGMVWSDCDLCCEMEDNAQVNEGCLVFASEELYMRNRHSTRAEKVILKWGIPRETSDGWKMCISVHLPESGVNRSCEIRSPYSSILAFWAGVDRITVLLSEWQENGAVFYFTLAGAEIEDEEACYELPEHGRFYQL